jgi:pimeloyl-ACP methyl ester carboxylesterase
MTHKTISNDYGTVHYWIGGKSKDCLVFTHGATMDHDLFRDQINYFCTNYLVITWDVPAHGQSRPYSKFTLQGAAEIIMAILDAEQINQAHLVGQSMGGFISQIAAFMYPNRVLSIVAVDSSPIQPKYYSSYDKWMLSATPMLLKLYPYKSLIKAIAQQVTLEPHSREYAYETLKQLNKNEISSIMGSVSEGLKNHKDNEKLNCPILIVYGESDTSGKVKAYCNQWVKDENRQLVLIQAASHNSNMDNPELFNSTLKNFLKDIFAHNKSLEQSP